MSACQTEARTQNGEEKRMSCLQKDDFVLAKQGMIRNGNESGQMSKESFSGK